MGIHLEVCSPARMSWCIDILHQRSSRIPPLNRYSYASSLTLTMKWCGPGETSPKLIINDTTHFPRTSSMDTTHTEENIGRGSPVDSKIRLRLMWRLSAWHGMRILDCVPRHLCSEEISSSCRLSSRGNFLPVMGNDPGLYDLT